MTGSAKKQFRKHRYPVKKFQGDPALPAYNLYSLWDYPTYLAVSNELDELIAEWPRNWQRTVALLGVSQAFSANGATHWAEQVVYNENQVNIHALMLYERQQTRRGNPNLENIYIFKLSLAEAALAESQRCKQHSPTGDPLPVRRRRIKILKLLRSYSSPAKNTNLSIL